MMSHAEHAGMVRSIEELAAATPDPVRRHYVIEQQLAARLRSSTRAERQHLYAELYDLLFQHVPHHPLVMADRPLRERVVASQVAFLRQLMPPGGVFMEVGAGDCRLACSMSGHARQVLAVDVSSEITKTAVFPSNCRLVLSSGCDIPLPDGSVDLAFSDQLMEHLHPADAAEQLRDIYRVMAPGGMYVLLTPSRLSGPHDVSRFFDHEATGFHLKEYTTGELASALTGVGFRSVRLPVWANGRVRLLPTGPVVAAEWIVGWAPRGLRRRLASRMPLKKSLGRVAAIK